MKTYIVFINGEEACMIKASNHNMAEKKARKLYNNHPPESVSVEYTEV